MAKNLTYPTITIGELLRLASRFPKDAILHRDGYFMCVEVPGDGYVSLDVPDDKIPPEWVEQK